MRSSASGRFAGSRASSLPASEVDLAAIDALFHGDSDERVQPQRQAVAQVPGKRLFVLPGRVAQARQLHGEIIPQLHELRAPFELGQPALRRFADTLPELIAFVEHPGVRRVRVQCLLESLPGLARACEHVEISDTQVPPHNG